MEIKIQIHGYVNMIIGYINGYMHRTLNESMESQGYLWHCHCIHGTTWMDPWIHGTAWIHQWIHDLFNRFPVFLLQKCIQEPAIYNWNHFVDPWIHYHHDAVYT